LRASKLSEFVLMNASNSVQSILVIESRRFQKPAKSVASNSSRPVADIIAATNAGRLSRFEFHDRG